MASTNLKITALIVATVFCAARRSAADTPAQKTCAQLLATGTGDEIRAAADGKWSKSNTGPICRSVILNVRAYKKIQAQCTAENNTDAANNARLNIEDAVVSDYALFVEFMGYRQSLSDLEEKRFDKQVGTDSSGAGTTSLTTKGTVPSLLGFAVENGAITRSVSGTTVTFRAVPWDVAKALAAHNYIASAPSPQPGTLSGLLSDISGSVSFDTSRGSNSNSQVFTGDKQQVSGYTLRYQILNWRDPRNIRYARAWDDFRTYRGQALANRLNQLASLIRTGPGDWVPRFEAWRTETNHRLSDATVDDVEKVITEQAQKFNQLVDGTPALAAKAKLVGDELSDYFTNRNETIHKITKSWTLAFEYADTQQANTNGNVMTTTTVATSTGLASPLPNLSNFKFIFNKGFKDGPEFTGNVSLTAFTNLPKGSHSGSLRDVQVTGQLDLPLPEILKVTNMVLSLSGQFVSLREQPLGQMVIINTKAVSTKGNIGLGQAKLTIPLKGSGVQIPISITWSNRTELILERDVRADIGITFDLDKLFAKP
jgi:hypothetical protein